MAASSLMNPSGWDQLQIAQMHLGMAPARILATALDLGFFKSIAAGHTTAAAVAQAAGATERGTRMVLDALAGIGLLAKQEGRYGLTGPAAQYLVEGTPDYLGDMLHIDRLWESWGRLTDVVRSGNAYSTVERQEQAEEFFPRLIRSLHVMNLPLARAAAETLGVGKKSRGLRVLDVGCGSAVWSIAVAEADPQARVTAQDFPGVLAHTREYVKRHGVENRFEYLPGDLNALDFGENRYDLALLGNIMHSEGEESSQKLLGKLHRAMRASGRVAIVDMIPNEDRSGPPFPLLFAINMLLNTAKGDVYSLAEYGAWLRAAGFEEIESHDIGSHSPLIVAHRR